ncbi:MAG: hypothetical protein M1827_003134 [Pycnora praestabilis]|nr:MAG: hypothetical protein M1827_003134 [Pycnora praestabilis]
MEIVGTPAWGKYLRRLPRYFWTDIEEQWQARTMEGQDIILSALLNANDPVAMHLLVETALGDSQEYEVLSFEEIDEMKKEYNFLTNRIEATKRKLTLESKVHDAARSLNRLYSKKGRTDGSDGSANVNRHRRSLLGSRGSGNDALNKTDDELANSMRKCEELAQELWGLEKRSSEIQKRLLQHTAGILQMTYKGSAQQIPNTKFGTQHGLPPGSPESMYTYPNNRGSIPAIDDDEFDDRSFYRTPDILDEFGGYDTNNGQGPDSRSQSRSPVRRAPLRNSAFVKQTQAFSFTERKLEDLNNRLRELIIQANPENNQQYAAPPSHQTDEESSEPGGMLHAQLEYLEQGLGTIGVDQIKFMQNTQRLEYNTEERLEELNNQLCNLINQSNSQHNQNYHPPPHVSGHSLESQITYLEEGLNMTGQQLQEMMQAAEVTSTKVAEHQGKVGQFETVLTGIWDIILSSEEEAREQKRRRLQARSHSRGQSQDLESDISPEEEHIHEEFSLQAFSAKVQSLYARATGLREQKNILRRQIRYQRELNDQSDAQKDAQLAQVTKELDHTRNDLDSTEREARGAREELTVVMTRLGEARRESTLREQQRGMDESAAIKVEKEARKEIEEELAMQLQQLRERQTAINKVDKELAELRDGGDRERAEMQTRIGMAEDRIRELAEDLQEADKAKTHAETARSEAEASIEEKVREIAHVQAEIGRLEGEVVRLQTEVTVARAELDGAYGTRAQRAAEVAANPAIQKEVDELAERNMSLLQEIATLQAEKEAASGGSQDLKQRVELLHKELSETMAEYEVMTKSSVDFEKEREQLESQIDSLKETCEGLEMQLGDEKVRWLGMMSPNGVGRDGEDGEHLPVQNTSTMVLKNEFKKMMRDMRAENAKALRAEQEERRRLESLIRSLKKDQTPGKSHLSQSMTVS